MSSADFLPFPLPSLSLISSKICEEFLRGKRGKLGQGEIPIRVVMGPLLLPTTIITENIPLFCIKPEKKSYGTFSVTIPRCMKPKRDAEIKTSACLRRAYMRFPMKFSFENVEKYLHIRCTNLCIYRLRGLSLSKPGRASLSTS